MYVGSISMTGKLSAYWRVMLVAATVWVPAYAPLVDAGVPTPAGEAAGAAVEVFLKAEPASTAVTIAGETTVELTAVAGTQTVDALETVVAYPTALLDVVNVTLDAGLGTPLRNHVDSARGQIYLSAGRGVDQAPPSGTFTLASLRFR